MIDLPENHPQRFSLSNEVHARPPEALTAPLSISCIALTNDGPPTEEDRAIVEALTRQYGATPPGTGAKHYSVDLGAFRFIWERHTEFTRFTFITHDEGTPFETPAISAAPSAWLTSIPGSLIAGAHVSLLDAEKNILPTSDTAEKFFSGNALIGADIADGSAVAVTDFRLHKDGFSRFLIQNRSMTPWHTGRIVQRLLEIETYRIMALLALPVAQKLVPQLTSWELELSRITAEMTEDASVDEPVLLERLTTLQAAIEKGHTESQFRFGAGAAYYALVQRRIEELRETRLPEMQTFKEFTERRLAPAMATCRSTENRQSALSERVDRAGQLLSTRVNLSLERQNQAVMESMNKRAELQLRLQQTVEGLSVAAITYYVVGVIGYMAKGAEASGMAINSAIAMGISAPLVLAIAAFGVWQSRKHLSDAADDKGAEER
ncbi:MAG: DUF3422 domain-containing protein [Pseudomonadota bacterium]